MCTLQEHGWLTELPILLRVLTLLLPLLDWPACWSCSPQGLSWETWTTLATGGLAVSFRHG